jgi:site-specific DNA-methyltransferase (adenine-specific)
MIMPAHYAILCFSKGPARPLPGLLNCSADDQEAIQPLAELYCLRSSCVFARREQGVRDTGLIDDLWYDIHRLKHNTRRVDHPCQLPPRLMRRLFALFTKPGEVILDCFNGAGTSTLVAEQMARAFIGIEISPKYHALAVRRHEELSRGRDPFGKHDEVPNAKNSPVERLPRQRYVVTKKTLQLEVRRLAQALGRLPTREEVRSMAKYPIEYYNQYFISWGEVCAAARTTGMCELPPQRLKTAGQLAIDFRDQGTEESTTRSRDSR